SDIGSSSRYAFTHMRTRSIASQSSGQSPVSRIAMSAAHDVRSRRISIMSGGGRGNCDRGSPSVSDQCGRCALIAVREARLGRLRDETDTADIETPWRAPLGAPPSLAYASKTGDQWRAWRHLWE